MAQDWLRLYRGAVNNPKVQRLGLEAVGFWTNCLCLSDDEGRLPKLSDLAWSMRVSETVAETFLKRLHETGLLEKKGAWFVLHDWHEHQFKSDSSTDRVRRFRQKQHETQRNVSETAQNRDRDRADTETDSEQKDSVATQLPAAPPAKPLDLKTELWKTTAAFLTARGVPDARARSFVGSLRKDHPDAAILNAFAAAESEATPDPIPFIKAVLAGKVKHAGQSRISDHPLGIFGQLAEELRPLPRARG